jgi:hypothetical protein
MTMEVKKKSFSNNTFEFHQSHSTTHNTNFNTETHSRSVYFSSVIELPINNKICFNPVTYLAKFFHFINSVIHGM